MMKKIFSVLIFSLIVFGLFKLLSSNSANTGTSFENADLVVFWGTGCPHCENVKKYISENNLETLVKISYKEVYYDKPNQKLLNETVKNCPEINSSQGVGVPLALVKSTGKCLYGDEPIIDWLKPKMLK